MIVCFAHFVFLVFYVNIKTFISAFEFSKTFEENYSNSDASLDSAQLLQKYSYGVETHIVITDDGYKLTVYRIPRKGPPVLLVHGITDSSDCWLVLGPKHSLAYQLADAGFDVWLFNARGNKYSKGHVRNLPPKLYWDFSYEEIGLQDIPATIDYVLSNRRMSKLIYIGYSLGTTAMFVMCSMRPEYNTKIDYAILLAPVAEIKHIKYPLIDFWVKNLGVAMNFSNITKLYEVLPRREKLSKLNFAICRTNSTYRFFCALQYYKNFGLIPFTNLLPERLPILTAHLPSGTSAKVLFHFIQGYATKKFQRFDYGRTENLQKYSSLFPPEYDVSKISVPMALFASEIDWYSNSEDVATLLSKLKTVNKFIFLNESVHFSHLEFIYGSRVNSIINTPVLNILKNVTKL